MANIDATTTELEDAKCTGKVIPPKSHEDFAYTVFEPYQRRFAVLLCALAGFFSPFSAFTYFPAIEYISEDLGVSNQLINMTITVYLVVQGIVPAFFGDLADQIGRRPVYLVILAIYAASCIGLALQSLGPVVGGALAEKAGWQWIFWVLTILGGLVFVLFALFFPETCRNVVGNGSIPANGMNKPLFNIATPKIGHHISDIAQPGGPKWKRMPNPFACLRVIFRKNAGLILTANATFYLLYSCIQAALAPVVMSHYGLDSFEAGLCYLPYGIATIASSYLIGKIMDFDYKVTAKSHGIVINTTSGDNMITFPIEQARLRSMPYYLLVSIFSTLGFGWSVEKGAHLSVPMVMLFLCGIATTGICLTLIVDLHPQETGLASVSVNLTRCTVAAIGVVALQPLLDSVGVGWTFTIFGAICLLSVPMLIAVRRWGPEWRNMRTG
ncbi:hypothetical protein PspLS_05200 [Pyricularia sp. CBS 133598]|nr:hypothetical protein PspLS_05200 [Pyricularia sp. CBS 133598]